MNPILPGTVKDRTGSTAIMRRVIKDIEARYKGLQVDVLAIFDRIPVYTLNDLTDRVLYGLTPEQLQAMSADLMAAYERWIAAGRDPAYSFWYSAYVEDATQLGTAQSVANLSNIAPAYAATRSIESIIYSTPYKTRLAMAQVKSYEHWTGLAAQQKSELAQIIGRAVVDGKNPRAVRTEIMDALGVSRSRAAQYAQTDITDTLRQARMAEAEYSTKELGLKIGMLWTSALLPSTRATHAARSGKVYTSAEVRDFYSKDGNRYRCHCSVTEALLDAEDNPILTDKLKASMQAEKTKWQASQPKK